VHVLDIFPSPAESAASHHWYDAALSYAYCLSDEPSQCPVLGPLFLVSDVASVFVSLCMDRSSYVSIVRDGLTMIISFGIG
jgi:hypothetical protein